MPSCAHHLTVAVVQVKLIFITSYCWLVTYNDHKLLLS